MSCIISGSCCCGAVSFDVATDTPQPYQLCFCEGCRKTSGGAGASINIMGLHDTLEVRGSQFVKEFARLLDGPDGAKVVSQHKRYFCSECGTHLYAYDERYTEFVYPVAGTIDTPLPQPVGLSCIMLEFGASWAKGVLLPKESDTVKHFTRYPKRGILDWHVDHGVKLQPGDTLEDSDSSG